MLLKNSEIPIMVKMANGETVVGKVLEMRAVKENTPFGRATLVLEDVATFQTGSHPQKQGQIVYNMLSWQTEDVYIPWDKILSFAVANTTVQDYYRSVFQRVQLADINEVEAVKKGAKQKMVIETP